MDSAKENLFALGDCEERIQVLELERARLPDALAAAETRAQEARHKVEAARERVEDAEKERRGNESKLQDAEAQRSKFQSQTALVKTNAEYTALLREIDGMTQRISATEEAILVGMEAVDEAATRLESIEKEQRAVEHNERVEIGKLEERLKAVEQSLAEHRDERRARLAALGPEAQRLYDRVLKVHTTGVARIKDGTCIGCHRR